MVRPFQPEDEPARQAKDKIMTPERQPTADHSTDEQDDDSATPWPRCPAEPSRSTLLVRACHRDVRRFHKIKAEAACHGEHSHPDDDGDMVSRSVAVELFDPVDLVVMIRPDLDRASRVRLLAKILEEEALCTYEQDPHFDWPPLELPEPRRTADTGAGFDWDDDDDGGELD